MENTIEIKLVLLGDSGVGKTSVVQRFVLDQFTPNLQSTRVAGFLCKSLAVPQLKSNVKFQIWDTAGQDKYRSMNSLYYKDAAVALLVFGLNNKESFVGARKWVEELREKGPSNILIVMAANKADLVLEQVVDLREAENYAASLGAQLFIVSAKESMNIKEMFEHIALKIASPGLLEKAGIKSLAADKNAKHVTLNGKAKEKNKCC
eukprot:TRINITY_DN5202_c0_g4_i4.p1 TRINITY_DN5202_c0_g4~~TRINITY_DN5202_c0_g4_i4.p1  ORF type:complete len:206 (+),score=83.02 TRINITY_DN5202_c0_g4_i4:217-834(+)